MNGGVIALIVIAVLVGLIAVWFVGIRNSLVSIKGDVEESFSSMDVYLKKRYDLVPNLVSTVKGATKHEKEALIEVVNARNSALTATTQEGKIEANKNLSSSLKNLFALAESYPDLKANSNFTELQTKLSQIEGEISNARRYYNACVKTFNVKIMQFPASIVANMCKFKPYSYYELDSAEERKNVKVEF